VDVNGSLLNVNEWLCAMSGFAKEELIGRKCHAFVHEEDRPADLEQFHRLMAGEFDTYAVELRFAHKDGHMIWAAVSASRVDDERGRPLYGIRVIRDITARKRAEETRTLLMHELNHRVKNTLSTVQSIVSQSLRKAGAPPQAKEDIESRLFALSRAHDVLTREGWEGAWLTEVVSEAITPYRREGVERFRIGGPDVRLNTAQALAMSMALQELCTNALKYGSLSVEDGRVDIDWSVSQTYPIRRLRLRWKESGGPSVEPPLRRGFGTRLIERGLAAELEGQVKIDFVPDGVECVADVPLR
jgi:PAS domain S-box-containing protein